MEYLDITGKNTLDVGDRVRAGESTYIVRALTTMPVHGRGGFESERAAIEVSTPEGEHRHTTPAFAVRKMAANAYDVVKVDPTTREPQKTIHPDVNDYRHACILAERGSKYNSYRYAVLDDAGACVGAYQYGQWVA